MKFSLKSIFSTAFLASAVSAIPLRARQNNAANSFGAVYFITNEGDENMVISADIACDGTLSFANAVSAGGRGAHGITGPDGPDGLFSQGSIKASQDAGMLVTINPGSNTVSLFSIDPENPSNLTMVGLPASSEGQFPMSIAFNKNGTAACVLNGGQVNNVNCYSVDPQLGLISMNNTLRAIGLNQTTPATGPAGSASHIIFNEDNTKLIASIKGVPPTPGFLATWDVADDGSLSADFVKSTPASGGLLPFSMSVIPGKNAVLATDAGVGFDIFDFSNGNEASSTIVPIEGQKATCWSTFSKQTGNFYLTDIGTSTVTEVNVDDNLKGSIVKQYPQTAESATIDNDIATIEGNDFLYVLSPNATQVNVLALNAPGQASSVQTFDISEGAKSMGVTINPNNMQGMTAYVKQN